LTLAAVAIHQLASRDARPGRDALHVLLAAAGVPATTADTALNWLISERLVVGPSDLRTPHQRFASVVLGRILAGQNATPDHSLTACRTRMTFRSHALATVQAGASKPSPEAAAHYEDRLIATLGVK